MIKTTIAMGVGIAIGAFALGCYVGCRTTLHVLDAVIARKQKTNVA